MKKAILALIVLVQAASGLYGKSDLTMIIINNTDTTYSLYNKQQQTQKINGVLIQPKTIEKISGDDLPNTQFYNFMVVKQGEYVSSSSNYYTQNVNSDNTTVFLSISETDDGDILFERLNPQETPIIVFNNTTEDDLLLKLTMPKMDVLAKNWMGHYSDQKKAKGLIFYKLPAQQITTITRPDLNVTVDSKGNPTTIGSLQNLDAWMKIIPAGTQKSSGLIAPQGFRSYNKATSFVQRGSSDGVTISSKQPNEATFDINAKEHFDTAVFTVKYQGSGYSINKHSVTIADDIS